MTPDAFAAFLDRLAATARSRPDVLGLVAFGSTAARERADQWSDHDFAWITRPGAEERYRQDTDWLPDPERIVLSAVAGHGGVTVLYDDGHVLEFGIATVADFAGWAGDRAEVIVGDASVDDALAAVLRRGAGIATVDAGRELRLALAKLVIGVGRARRGEFLSADGLIGDEAMTHLLRALRAARGHPELDPRRRFERHAPELAARLLDVRLLAAEPAARELLRIAETELAGPGFPGHAVSAIRRRFRWGGDHAST